MRTIEYNNTRGVKGAPAPVSRPSPKFLLGSPGNVPITGSAAPKVVKWKSNGSGVVYSPARGVSRRKYYALELERVAREAGKFEAGRVLIKAR